MSIIETKEIDENFVKLKKDHSNWPYSIESNISKNALIEFRDKVNLDNLRELPCALCSKLCDNKDFKEIQANKIDLSLIEAPQHLIDPSFEIDFHYNHPYIDSVGLKILFDRNRFIPCNSEPHNNNVNDSFNLRVCKICLTSLQNHKTPPLSLANNMWIGPTPSCLQGLTIPEQILISPGYTCINIIQLTNKRHTHHKLKGHIITLPQNPGSLIKTLLLPTYHLCEYIKIMFIGHGKPTDYHLKKHNILFKDFKFNKTVLDAFPEGDIPDSLLLTTTHVNLDPREFEHYTGYVQDLFDHNESDSNNDENSMSETSELRPSGILNTDNIPMTENKLNLLAIQKLANNINKRINTQFDTPVRNNNTNEAIHLENPIIYISHGHKPLNEYRDNFLFPAAFPVLFPYGIGGYEGHIPRVFLKEYLNHLMQVSSAAYNLTKDKNFERSADLITTITPENIKKAIEQEQNNEPITNTVILELLRNINIAGSKLMASHHPIVMMYAGNEININTLLPKNFPKATEHARLAHLDPSAVSKYFDVITKLILNTVIGYNRKEGGVFGFVKNYYGVIEYQDRGTPHCHLLLWLHGSLNPIEIRKKLKDDNEFCQCLLSYVSDIVREDINYFTNGEIITDKMLETEYKTPKSVEERRMHPSFFSILDPNLSNFAENFHLDLLSIVKRTLFYHCNKFCKKYNHGFLHECRFDFPRELVNPPSIIIPEQGVISVQCTNAFINNHNPYITSSYHSRKLITKCLNRIAGQTELTGPQISAYLLGLNDHYTPCKFAHIHVHSFEYYLINKWTAYNYNIVDNADYWQYTQDNDQNFIPESFLITASDNNLTTANLRIDYQF
ncbi:17087_t:CDS:2 [Cetraspora pellucida]|uniref:17087_t:CDS:1 n=1 Tax=Cetraspora pellucida TaxID=1433469 RepID=A0A9N9H8R3_9GLOM|nr:17087_t:CDS:2 [Cetraspora pellucida]